MSDLISRQDVPDINVGDMISRQDAIRLAEQGQIQGFEWQFKKLCELPSAEPDLRGKCAGCFYVTGNYGACDFCMRNFPDRYSKG